MNVNEISLSTAALETRVDQGLAPALTWDQALEAVTTAVDGKTNADLVALLTYQTCQVVALRNSADQDARLAIQNVERIVRDYVERRTS